MFLVRREYRHFSAVREEMVRDAVRLIGAVEDALDLEGKLDVDGSRADGRRDLVA